MDFRLLGSVEAVREGRELDIGGPGQRRLLAMLLLHAGEVIEAERIGEALWGADPPQGAAMALQARISRLRRVLEPDTRVGAAAALLVTRGSGYMLRATPSSIDLNRFEQSVADGRKALAGGEARTAVDCLDRALGLWNGPAFGGFADEDFCRASATWAEELRRGAAEDLLEARLALGAHSEVIGEAQALADGEPLRERRWGLLMLALYRSGRQAEALAACQRLRRTLGEELGISPGPEIRRLEQSILEHGPELDWTRPGPSPLAAPDHDRRPAETEGSHRPRGPAGEGGDTFPFFGRVREMAQLDECLEAAVQGRGRIALIGGHPGIGKTRLAEQLVESAAGRGVATAWGRCFEAAAAPPLWPWVQVLRTVATGAAAGAHVRRLEAETMPEAARLEMFAELADALIAAARSRPLVVVLDDVQWADTASLLFLQFLAPLLATSAVLVVALHRDVGLEDGHPLVGVLARLAPLPLTRRLTIDGLDTDAVAQVVRSASGELPGEVAAAVYRRTEGNPFFVSEVARLLAAGAAGSTPTTLLRTLSAIPTGVRDVVRRRLSILGDGTVQLLRIGAAIGRDFDLNLLAELAALSDDDLLGCVEQALAAGFLKDDVSSGADTCRFVHDIVRETIYAETSALRRSGLHRRIAEALESRLAQGGAVGIAQVAHHFHLAARGGGDVARAIRYGIEAADEAIGALAYEDAIGHLLRCLESCAIGDDDGATRGRLLLRLGDAHWRAGDVAKARGAFLEAADLGRRMDDTDLLARAVLGYGGGLLRAWHSTADVQLRGPVLDLLEEALRGLGEQDSGLRARLLGHLAEELYFANSERRISLSGDAVAMARRLGDPRTLALTLCSRSLAIWDPDHLEDRVLVIEEILELAGTLGDRQLEIFGRQYLFVAQMEQGDIAHAGATLDRFEEMAEALRQPLYLWEARRFRALQALLTGRFSDAERLAFEALEMGQRAEEPDAMGVFGAQYGMLRIELGRAEEIEPALRSLAEEFPDTPTWLAALCFVAVELGHVDQARGLFDRLMVNGFADQPRNFAWLSGVAMLADVAARLGDVGRSRTLYDLLAPFAGRNVLSGDRIAWGSASLYLGMLAATTGDDGRAEEHFEFALAMNDGMGARPWVAHTCHQYALSLVRRAGAGGGARERAREQERAQALIRRALRIADDCGMGRLVARLHEIGKDGP